MELSDLPLPPACPDPTGPQANVELKARLPSLDDSRRIAQQLATSRLPDERQIDTYFECRSGRLKLREINGRSAQLIWYRRADRSEAKASSYFLMPVADPDLLKKMLGGALGVRATVDKRREIYLFHNVRIHLDTVQRLGCFLEFEAVLCGGSDPAEGHRQVRQLQERFQIPDADLCAGSYSDMLLAAH